MRIAAGTLRLDLGNRMPFRLALRGAAARLPLSDTAKDLVEVAGACLLADRLVRRPQRTGTRQIALRLLVRKPGVWRRVTPLLEEVLDVLAGDRFSFEFSERAAGGGCFPTARAVAVPRTSRVALFSGGLDSACGAAALCATSEATLFVTHYVTGARRIVGLLADIAEACAPDANPLHALYYFHPTGPVVARLRENSRRTRPFLFAALAAAAASGAGADDVYVCENGPLAINLPLHDAMVPTRHAHRVYLDAMARLSQQLFARPIAFRNPFELHTKGQMTRVFAARPELALRTVSCWNQQWSGRGRSYGAGHCGHCLPCLVRLVSFQAAGIPIPPRHFDVDVRVLARRGRRSLRRETRLVFVRALTTFAGHLRGCRSWRDLGRRFPALIETAPTMGAMSSEEWFQKVFVMMRRFGEEIEAALGSHFEA